MAASSSASKSAPGGPSSDMLGEVLNSVERVLEKDENEIHGVGRSEARETEVEKSRLTLFQMTVSDWWI